VKRLYLLKKLRIPRRPLNVSLEFALDIAKAYGVLHYFVHQRDGYKSEDIMEVTGLEDAPDGQSIRGG